jgi:hypothetical protein
MPAAARAAGPLTREDWIVHYLGTSSALARSCNPLISGTNVLDGNPYVLTADAPLHQLTTHRLVLIPGKEPGPQPAVARRTGHPARPSRRAGSGDRAALPVAAEPDRVR